jgi:Ca2+-binding EF-hand superfamily protein
MCPATCKEFITEEDLNIYLRRHNFIPRKSDLEALLRRCDHEGKLKLNYKEFVEVASCNEAF